MSSFFSYVQDDTATGGVERLVDSDVTTVVARSRTLYAPAGSTVCVHVSGTATVVIKSNPFADAAKDVTLTSVSASTEYAVASARHILVDVTAVSGTVTAKLVCNED
jgi:hypothetical protein